MFTIKWFCAVSLLAGLCSCDSYFSQEVGDKTDNKVPVGVALIMKSQKVKKLIEDPSGYGRDLTKELYFFLEELQLLLKTLEEKNFALTEAQVNTIKALVKNGGPDYLKASISNGLLIGRYGWTNLELNDFVEMMNDTKGVWQKLEKTARDKEIV